MASSKWLDHQFGQRLRQLRVREGWTQHQISTLLTDQGIAPMHATTVAKIEAGDRAVRINEAVAIANLFEVSLDVFVGRQVPDDSTITFALVTWSAYADDAKGHIGSAQEIATDILELVDDGKERFDDPAVETIYRAALALRRHLGAAHTDALQITALANNAIITNKEPPQRARRQRPAR